MKISIFCAGVVGTIYSWVIIQANKDIKLPVSQSNMTVCVGVFRPTPVFSLYIINPSDSAAGCLAIQNGTRFEGDPLLLRLFKPEGDRLMLRVFDPEEKLTLWQYLEFDKLKDTLGHEPKKTEVYGIPSAIQGIIIPPGTLMLDVNFPLPGGGIHQVRVTAGLMNSLVTVDLDRNCDYGVSFQNGIAYPWNPAIKVAYIYIPPHAEQLTLQGEGIQVEDETGKIVFPESGKNDLKKEITLQVLKTNVVWTFRFLNPTKWKFTASGFPLILCNTSSAAETIKASVEVLGDGTVVCHKFQRRIAEVLPTLLKPERVGDTKTLLTLWNNSDPNWFEQPSRSIGLLGGYGLFAPLVAALSEQNLDSTSHWSGAIGSKVWQKNASSPYPINRWDRLGAVPGLWAGASPNMNYAQALAEAADLDIPMNPWFGRSELRWRAAASALRDLMTIGEDEIWHGIGADMDSYPGWMAFVVTRKNFPEFALTAKHLPPDIRALWTEGLQHIFDRHFPDYIVANMNQSSHYLVGWECFAQGSGNPHYKDLVLGYAQWFANHASPAGYFMEDCGPDATYCGMQHHHMALYYLLSGDTTILKALRNSYRFFNHTVAPEPGGRVVGGFNFAHRTPDGFHNEQYSGAKGLLDDVLPEVGLWTKDLIRGRREQDLASLKEQLTKPLPEPAGIDFGTPRYKYWTDNPDRKGIWPAKEKQSFIRVLGNELISVKSSAYYTAVYVGKPVRNDWYIRDRNIFRKPLPERAEDTCVDPWSFYLSIHPVSPLLGGGMTLFWTPGYGNAILAGNFTPLVHHGLVAIDKEGERWWEDYFATSFELNESARTLSISGKIEKQPLRYMRLYHFLDDRVEVEIRLETDKECIEFDDLIENLPLLGGPVKVNGQTITVNNEQHIIDTIGVPEGKKVVKSTAYSRIIFVTNHLGQGVEIRLDKEHNLRVCRSGMVVRNFLRFDRIEIVLPNTLTKAAPVTLSYALIPVDSKTVIP